MTLKVDNLQKSPELVDGVKPLKIVPIDPDQGRKLFHEMVYSRDVEGEDDPELVAKERAFAVQLEAKLSDISEAKVVELVQAMEHFNFREATADSILLDKDFPYVVMAALYRGYLSPTHGHFQAATALMFWSALQYHDDPDHLFTIDLFESPDVVEVIHEVTNTKPPYLRGEKLKLFLEKVKNLPASEHRFMIVPDLQNSFHIETVSQQIQQMGYNLFNRIIGKGKVARFIPSAGMMQALLEAEYGKEAVTIAPRLYLSTAKQIRDCGGTDTRDLMVPFPSETGESRCPATADDFQAPWYDFPYHDFYHAVTTSAIGMHFRRALIEASDIVAKTGETSLNRAAYKEAATSIADMDYHFFDIPNVDRSVAFWYALDTDIARSDLSQEEQKLIIKALHEHFKTGHLTIREGSFRRAVQMMQDDEELQTDALYTPPKRPLVLSAIAS